MDIERTAERIDQTGEIFTPSELVNEILDEVPEIFFTDASKTICEPSVGEGIFLVEILKRRILNGLIPTNSLHTLYGVDIMEDNVEMCKRNLLKIAGNTAEHREIVEANIVCANSLEYNFKFKETEDIE